MYPNRDFLVENTPSGNPGQKFKGKIRPKSFGPKRSFIKIDSWRERGCRPRRSATTSELCPAGTREDSLGWKTAAGSAQSPTFFARGWPREIVRTVRWISAFWGGRTAVTIPEKFHWKWKPATRTQHLHSGANPTIFEFTATTPAL
jgi:hypothetical protein